MFTVLFPHAQGRQSDRYGRKTILLICYVGPALGYFAMALSGSLSVLVLSRIPTGMTGVLACT